MCWGHILTFPSLCGGNQPQPLLSSYRCDTADPHWPKNSRQRLRSSLKNSGLVNGRLYILMCNRQSFQQTADRLAFIGGGYFFLMAERTHNKDKWFLHLPFSPSSLPSRLLSLTHRPACFPSPSSFLSAHLLVFTPHPPLLLSVWHLRRRCGACAPPLNGAACEWQQRVTEEQ